MKLPFGRLRQFDAALLFTAALVVGALSAPDQARANEAQVWAAATAANANDAAAGGQWGPGAQLGARLGLSDFWSLIGGVDASYHFARTVDDDQLPSAEVLGLFAGVRYNLDVFKYIPYLSVSAVPFLRSPPDQTGTRGPRIGAKASVGVDWRFARSWSAGGAAELYVPVDDPGNFPFYSTVGLNLAHHFRF